MSIRRSVSSCNNFVLISLILFKAVFNSCTILICTKLLCATAFGDLKIPVYKAFGDIYKVSVKSKTLNSLSVLC